MFGRNIYALQFHLEVTPEIINSWADAYAVELEEFYGPGAAARLKTETGAIRDEYNQVAARFLANWSLILSESLKLAENGC